MAALSHYHNIKFGSLICYVHADVDFTLNLAIVIEGSEAACGNIDTFTGNVALTNKWIKV